MTPAGRRGRKARGPKGGPHPPLSLAAFLVVAFAVLAYGGVEPWAKALLVPGAALLGILGSRAAFTSAEGGWVTFSQLPPLLAPALALLLCLPLFQILPLGHTLSSLLSPGALEVQRISDPGGSLRRLSLLPAGTIMAGSLLAAALCVFSATFASLGSRRSVRNAVRNFLLLGFSIALFGIIQKLTWNGRIYWTGASAGNPFGPYVNKNHFAGLMTMLLPVAVGYVLSLRHRARSDSRAVLRGGETGTGEGRGEILSRQTLALFMIAVMLQALLMSLSRGGAVSALAGFAFMCILFATGKGTRRRVWLLGALLLLATATAFWLGTGGALGRLATLLTLFDDPSELFKVRVAILGDLPPMVRDFTFFGSGLGTFGEAYLPYRTFETAIPMKAFHAHNDLAQILVEGGVAGFALALTSFAALFVHSLRKLARRRDREAASLGYGALAGLAAFAFHSFTTYNFHVPANFLAFSYLAGLTLAIVDSPGAGISPFHARKRVAMRNTS